MPNLSPFTFLLSISPSVLLRGIALYNKMKLMSLEQGKFAQGYDNQESGLCLNDNLRRGEHLKRRVQLFLISGSEEAQDVGYAPSVWMVPDGQHP